MADSSPSPDTPQQPPGEGNAAGIKWYQGISKYQWLVLLIASLGWVFDVFEGQIFVASMRDAMPQLLGDSEDGIVRFWTQVALGSFLLGGAVGGVFFGVLSDRIGRSKTMIITILFYSLFTCVTAFATEAWHMVVLRFFVAMGVGGEWAVASSMVAEVMPQRSRAVMGSIFHASSVFGTYLATMVGFFVIAASPWGENTWRLGFMIGVVPALLTVWIRWKLHEPEQWVKARERVAANPDQKQGRISELFNAQNLRSTLVGVSLATIGLATFWGAHIYGKNALMDKKRSELLVQAGLTPDSPAAEKAKVFEANAGVIKRAEMMSMFVNTTGGGIGLLLFGWISNRLGRKGAFVFYHVGAFVISMIFFKFIIGGGASLALTWITLPVFGFLTLGMHAGYAVYFPELYPTRLRGTGAGFCFNMGRLVTFPMLLLTGWMERPESDGGLGYSLAQAASLLSWLFLLGVVVVLFARETRGSELPE
jgi:MFS family permease